MGTLRVLWDWVGLGGLLRTAHGVCLLLFDSGRTVFLDDIIFPSHKRTVLLKEGEVAAATKSQIPHPIVVSKNVQNMCMVFAKNVLNIYILYIFYLQKMNI